MHRSSNSWFTCLLLAALGVWLAACCSSRTLARVQSLGRQAERLEEQGRPAEALVPAHEALELAGAELEPSHPTVTEAQCRLGRLLAATGSLDRSATLLQTAYDTRARTLSPNHPDVAQALNELGNTRYQQGDYHEAESLYRRALSLREQALGANHPQVADSLDDLGWLQKTTGHYAEAQALHERAWTIRREAFGPAHPACAQAMANLADVFFRTGDYTRSRRLQIDALALREAHFGPDHLKVAVSLNNLGELLRETGDLVAARRAYQRSLDIKERALGPQHPSVAIGLNNLGLLHALTGDLVTARRLWERALAIREKTLGPDHPRVAFSLANLGQLLTVHGQFSESLGFLERALRILAERLGTRHAMLAHVNNGLGEALLGLGDLPAAQTRFEQALAIWEQALGPRHPDQAQALSSLGHLQRSAGFPELAERAYGRAREIRAAALGPDHPDVAESLHHLAVLARSRGDRSRARTLAASCLSRIEDHVQPLLAGASERQRLALIRAHRAYLDDFLLLFDQPQDASAAHRAVLRWKGVVSQIEQAEQARALKSADPQTQQRLEALRGVQRELARLAFDGGLVADRQEQIRALTERKERLERELGGGEPAEVIAGAAPQVICRRLGPAEALVDFVRITDPLAAPDADRRYLAFVLAGGACDSPLRLDLGEAGPIDRAVTGWRRLIQGQASSARIDRTGVRLRELVWDPVGAAAGTRRRLWIVPDGSLSAVPFAALPDSAGGVLIERTSFSYLGSALDLLRPTPTGGKGALVVGGANFRQAERSPPGAAGPGPQAPKEQSGLFPVADLPETANEARTVARLLEANRPDQVTLLTGPLASEGNVKQAVSGKRILHLASHGFFATGRLRSALAGTGTPRSDTLTGYNPLLLSGVVLAGANADNPGLEDEDGVLTAEEVSGLDLSRVELVVLSGCDTGLGELVDGQGVMGLRRAFAAAGAGALVLGLWRLPDRDTRELVEDFYRRWVADPAADPVEALRQAQLSKIARLRARGGPAHPRAWAGLVLSGR